MAALVGPALWLGGADPRVVPIFCLVSAALAIGILLRTQENPRIPGGVGLAIALVALTAVQALPLPNALVGAVAPGIFKLVADATCHTDLDGWNYVGVWPEFARLELARLIGLTLLFFTARRISWRTVCGTIVAAATIVALIGLAHEATDSHEILWFYQPHFRTPGETAAILTTFVNPNHQSALFLLGLASAAALGLDQRIRSFNVREEQLAAGLTDMSFLTLGCFFVVALALVLSLSRGALLVFGAMSVPAIGLIARSWSLASETKRSSIQRMSILAAPALAIAGAVFFYRARPYLETLGHEDGDNLKLKTFTNSISLLSHSPVVGIGRGSFADVFRQADIVPTKVIVTHLESFPLMAVVEWGPVGGAVMVGTAVWWILAFRRSASLPRRVALLGLAAVALHSTLDYGLEYLGVSASTVALAGSLSWHTKRALDRRVALAVVGILGLLGVTTGALSLHASWTQRVLTNAAISSGTLDPRESLRERPLDPRLYLAMARAAGSREEWELAGAHASVCARLDQSNAECPLWIAESARARGDDIAAMESHRAALERVEEVDEALIAYLVEQYPAPEDFVPLAPRNDRWPIVGAALAEHAPEVADALGRARLEEQPTDIEALQVLARANLALDRPFIALHYAELLVFKDPERARGYLYVADALTQMDESPARVIQALDAGAAATLDDPGLVEERLVRALLAAGDEASVARAGELVKVLLTRRTNAKVRLRRRELARAVREQRQP